MELHCNFTGFSKAFDHVWQGILWTVTKTLNISKRMVPTPEIFYYSAGSKVLEGNTLSK